MPVVRFEIERQVSAPVPAVWRAMSNTDAFNRAAQMGFQFEVTAAPDGTAVRTGWFRRLGMRLEWTEEPFAFVAPDRFRSERRFRSGPLATLIVEVQFTSIEAGTQLLYRVELHPRNALTWPLVLFDATFTSKPELGRTIDRVLASVEAGEPHYDAPAPLSAEAEGRLVEGLAVVPDVVVRAALASITRTAPIVQQVRIRPRALAQEVARPEGEVLAACLSAVGSAMELRFLVLCPRCRGASQVLESLDFEGAAVHCDTCNIDFQGSLSDNVEVVLRPLPSIRPEQPVIDCLQSPGHTPHVLFQASLQRGAVVEQLVTLDVGCFRLDAHPVPGAMHLEVGPTGADTIVVDLDAKGFFPRRVEVRAGSVKLRVRSRVDRDHTVSLARRERPELALTLGGFLAHESCIQWLSSSRVVEIVRSRGAVVAAVYEVDAEPPEVPARAAHVQRRNGLTILGFERLEEALSAALEVCGPERTVGVSHGNWLALQTALVGPAVDRALETARAVGWGRVGVHPAVLQHTAFSDFVSEREIDVVEGWGVRPSLLRPTGGGALRRVATDAEEIGGYRLLEVVAEGGMGIVHRAEGPDGQAAAVKVLYEDVAMDQGYLAAFYVEAHLGWTIQHPHVVRVLDWGFDAPSRRAYLAMEYLEGESLYDRAKREGRVDDDTVIGAATDLLGALAAIHDAGIVHRDIKPANIMLTPRGAVLVDFGIAHRVGEGMLGFAGTVPYMSPEQARERPCDARSDLYQLALVLVRCSTGRWLVPGDDDLGRLANRVTRPITQLPPGFPAPLQQVFLKALQLDPEDRYTSARQMLAAVEEELATPVS